MMAANRKSKSNMSGQLNRSLKQLYEYLRNYAHQLRAVSASVDDRSK